VELWKPISNSGRLLSKYPSGKFQTASIRVLRIPLSVETQTSGGF